MTINLKELQADREAGTAGDWDIVSVSQDTGALGIASKALPRVILAQVHNGPSFMDVVNGCHPEAQYANAHRIARLPHVEAALIEAVGVLRLWALYDSSVRDDDVQLMIDYNNALKGTRTLLAKLGAEA